MSLDNVLLELKIGKNLKDVARQATKFAKKENSKEAAGHRRLFPQEVIKNNPVWERRVNRFFTILCIAGIIGVWVAVKLGWIF